MKMLSPVKLLFVEWTVIRLWLMTFCCIEINTMIAPPNTTWVPCRSNQHFHFSGQYFQSFPWTRFDHTVGIAPSDGTYTNGAVASIHNHADNYLLVGIGQIQAVLNGVEFRTRHNDFNIQNPSASSGKYGETEQVSYPEVPPEVSNQNSVDKQIDEMQEWFRAFKHQNKTHRNYTQYFKPILCCLSLIFWLNSCINEPFESDRHFIDARTWQQLHDKLRWFTNSGRKY